MHEVFLLVGSNIQPEVYIPAALVRLRAVGKICKVSPVWETAPIGTQGPNFLNLVTQIRVGEVSFEDLKYSVFRKIEEELGRVRTRDKNAPRTIDLDILILDLKIIDPGIWRNAHIACPLSALLPDLPHPETGQSLKQVADALMQNSQVQLRPDLHFDQTQ